MVHNYKMLPSRGFNSIELLIFATLQQGLVCKSSDVVLAGSLWLSPVQRCMVSPVVLAAWIIQTDVDFPQCPPSVLCPLSHQLISTMPVIAESTICSAPTLFEMGRPPHLDPCLPLLLLLLFIPSVCNINSVRWKDLTAHQALRS